MSTGLDHLLEFCVEHGLLDSEASARIACDYDRHWESIIGIVVKCGVDERKMYETAADIHQLPLVTPDQLTIEKDALDCVPLNHARQLSCIPYALKESVLSVVTSNWDRLEVVSKGMENLTGKKIHVSLMSESDYSVMYERVVNQ